MLHMKAVTISPTGYRVKKLSNSKENEFRDDFLLGEVYPDTFADSVHWAKAKEIGTLKFLLQPS